MDPKKKRILITEAGGFMRHHLCMFFSELEHARTIPATPMRLLALACEMLSWMSSREPPVSRRSLEFFSVCDFLNSAKARTLLGYEPQYSFEEGLVKIKCEAGSQEITQRSGWNPPSKQKTPASFGV